MAEPRERDRYNRAAPVGESDEAAFMGMIKYVVFAVVAAFLGFMVFQDRQQIASFVTEQEQKISDYEASVERGAREQENENTRIREL